MKKLALFGGSGHGKVVADIAICLGWSNIVFFDDSWPSLQECGSWAVSGDSRLLIDHIKDFDGVFVSIGSCEKRWSKHQQLKNVGAQMTNLIHPRAWVSSSVVLETGSVVMPGAVINTDARLGEACIVNTGATIDHDCFLGHGVHISPGAHLSGGVTVGDCSWVGLGALVKQGISIGQNVTVGAGAVVVTSVADKQLVVGIPAREVPDRHPQNKL